MDKAEGQLSISLAKHTVLVMKDVAKRCDSVDKVLTTFAVMMNMNLYVRKPVMNHLCQRFNQRRMVLFLRKEKSILW